MLIQSELLLVASSTCKCVLEVALIAFRHHCRFAQASCASLLWNQLGLNPIHNHTCEKSTSTMNATRNLNKTASQSKPKGGVCFCAALLGPHCACLTPSHSYVKMLDTYWFGTCAWNMTPGETCRDQNFVSSALQRKDWERLG